MDLADAEDMSTDPSPQPFGADATDRRQRMTFAVAALLAELDARSQDLREALPGGDPEPNLCAMLASMRDAAAMGDAHHLLDAATALQRQTTSLEGEFASLTDRIEDLITICRH